MQLLSRQTREEAFTEFAHMPTADFNKELQAILEARSLYMNSHLIDSSVFSYLDDMFDIIRDALVYRTLPD